MEPADAGSMRLREIFIRSLKNVSEAADARQKQPKKRSVRV